MLIFPFRGTPSGFPGEAPGGAAGGRNQKTVDISAVWCYHPSIGIDGDGARIVGTERGSTAGRASGTSAPPTTPEPDAGNGVPRRARYRAPE